MEKVIVYCETHGQGRRFYPEREGQAVGYRIASEFESTEKADIIVYQKDYKDIKNAYEKKQENKSKK